MSSVEITREGESVVPLASDKKPSRCIICASKKLFGVLALLAFFTLFGGSHLSAQASPLEDGFAKTPQTADSLPRALDPPITYRAPVHPEVKLRVDSATMLLGSRNRLVVTGPTGLSAVDFSALAALPAIVPLGEATDSVIGLLRQWTLPFSVYDSVGLSVPGLPIVVNGESFRTNDVAFVVSFPQLDTSIVTYRGIYRESAQLRDFAVWIALGVGLLILASLAYFYLRARVPEQVLAKAAPPTPPDEIALARLRRLRERNPTADEAFYTELDHTLRSYLEARFNIPALERTSTEVAVLLSREALPTEKLQPLLDRVDLVKFARAAVSSDVRHAHLTEVETFVRLTPPPAPADEGAPDAAASPSPTLQG